MSANTYLYSIHRPTPLSTLYLDYDGTLVDILTPWLEDVNITHASKYCCSDVSTWNWFRGEHLDQIKVFSWFKKGIYKNNIAIPYNGAQDFVKYIRFWFHTKVLTATHDSILIEEKNNHAYTHFGNIEVIHEENKCIHATSRDGASNILIDDKAETCEEWVKKGGIAFLFNYSNRYQYVVSQYCSPNLYRVHSYNEIEKILMSVRREMYTL